MKAIQIAGLITTLFVSGLATADNVYKSVDEDGIVAFGDTADEAGNILVNAHAAST